jgi:hypothetical protein
MYNSKTIIWFLHDNMFRPLFLAVIRQYLYSPSQLSLLSPLQTQQQENDNYQRFHPKVQNLSNIQFTENETHLLNKGLKYSLHFKPEIG